MIARPLKGSTELPENVPLATPCMRKGSNIKCELVSREMFQHCANHGLKKDDNSILLVVTLKLPHLLYESVTFLTQVEFLKLQVGDRKPAGCWSAFPENLV